MTAEDTDESQVGDGTEQEEDEFTLYDLRVECVEITAEDIVSYEVGDYFEVHGEELVFPAGQTFSMYALASLLPLLPAKQRPTHENDWMTTDTVISGPDPNAGGRFEITRIGTTTFSHGDVTAVELDGEAPDRDENG